MILFIKSNTWYIKTYNIIEYTKNTNLTDVLSKINYYLKYCHYHNTLWNKYIIAEVCNYTFVIINTKNNDFVNFRNKNIKYDKMFKNVPPSHDYNQNRVKTSDKIINQFHYALRIKEIIIFHCLHMFKYDFIEDLFSDINTQCDEETFACIEYEDCITVETIVLDIYLCFNHNCPKNDPMFRHHNGMEENGAVSLIENILPSSTNYIMLDINIFFTDSILSICFF